MMHKKKKTRWKGIKLILFLPIVLLLLQAFSKPEMLVEKAGEFVPIITQENEKEKWLERWTLDNINHGVYQPYGLKVSDPKKSSNNKLTILLNRKDQFLIENQPAQKEDIKKIVKGFLQGESIGGFDVPDFVHTEIPELGKRKVCNGLISFQHDFESSEETINFTLKSIGEACFEVRNAHAKESFNQDYFKLDKSKREAIDMLVPIFFNYSGMRVSKPNSVKVFLTENGKLIAWDKDYTFEMLETHLLNAKEDVAKGYRKFGYQFPFVVDVTTENGVPISNINRLKEIFKRCGISEVNYGSESAKGESHPKTLIVHLKKDKLYINGRSLGVRKLKTKVENLVIQDKSIKWVELLLYEYEALSQEFIKEVRTELKQIEIAEYKERRIPVMEKILD